MKVRGRQQSGFKSGSKAAKVKVQGYDDSTLTHSRVAACITYSTPLACRYPVAVPRRSTPHPVPCQDGPRLRAPPPATERRLAASISAGNLCRSSASHLRCRSYVISPLSSVSTSDSCVYTAAERPAAAVLRHRLQTAWVQGTVRLQPGHGRGLQPGTQGCSLDS